MEPCRRYRRLLRGLVLAVVLALGLAVAPTTTVAADQPASAPRVLLVSGFEPGLGGWKARRAKAVVVPRGRASARAVRVKAKRGSRRFSLYAQPRPVSSTSAGALYVARAWVRGRPGQRLCLRLREFDSNAKVGFVRRCVAAKWAWKRVLVTYQARGDGHDLDVSLVRRGTVAGAARRTRRARGSFFADSIRMTTTAEAPLLLLPPPPSTTGPAFYVSPEGSDSNPGSAAEPWLTVGSSLRKLAAGDTLYLRGGVYVERITSPPLAAGTPSAPITVRAYPGERPVIAGLLWLKGMRYWTLDGVNVTWDSATGGATEHMVKLTDGVGWRITNAEIWGARSFAGVLVAGTTAGEPSDWSIDHSCVHDTYPSNGTNQDHNIYVNTGLSAGPGIIERNLLFEAPNGENVKLDSGSSGSSVGTANVTVRFNSMYNAAQPILIGNGSHDNLIYGNIIQKGLRGYMLRGYKLSGAGNLAGHNVWFDSGTPSRLIYNDSSSTSGIGDGGGNVNRTPDFDLVGCDGFHPQDAVAQAFGRFAP